MKKIPIYILILTIFSLAVFPVLPFHSTEAATYTYDYYNADTGQTETITSTVADEPSADKPFGLVCSIMPWKFDPGACVALIGYYLFWYPTAALLMLAAAIFDTMAAWSFNADILRSGMVSSAWGMLRDLSNLALIFALLYIAIATILQIGGVQLKKAVANVIIVALLINFSFFVTEVVIDASNILASSLYGRIVANAAPGTGLGPAAIGTGGTGVLQISSRIVSTFDVQKFLTEDIVKAWDKARNGKSSIFFVFVFAAFVNVVAAYAFLKAGLLLVGRVVMFVFLIISSPLAFAAWALPGGGGGFDKKWWSALVDQALVAPVFFLFLYVITSVYSKGLIDGIIGTSTNQDFIPFLVNISLHFIVVIVALLIAVKVTTKLSGAAGAYATKVGGAVVGGAVLGGGAMVARNTIGRGAARLTEKVRDSEWAKNNPTLGRVTKGGLDLVSSSSFDARGVSGIEGLGKASKGGYAGGVKRLKESKEGYAKFMVGGERGNAEVDPGKYASDDDRKLFAEKQRIYNTAMSTHQEEMKAYEKNMAEFSTLSPAIQQKRIADNRAPKKPEEPKKPTFTISAKERLARQYDKSIFRSTRQAAENVRKGKGGKKSVQEQLKELLEDEGEIGGGAKEKTGSSEEKPKET